MQVFYYCDRWFVPTCVPITNDWRDDGPSFKFTGPTWCQWYVPGTVED